MQIELLVVAFVSMVSGIIASVLVRKVAKTSGFVMGLSIFLLGVAVWTAYYALFPVDIVSIAIIGLLALFFASAYFVSGRNARLFVLLGWILYPIIRVNMLPAPSILLLVYIVVSVAIMNAADYARLSVADCMTRADDYFRVFLLPFSWIERQVKSTIRGGHTRLALAGGYLLFDLLVLVAIPLLLALVQKWLGFEELVLIFLFLVVLSNEECSRGLKRLEGGSKG